MCSGGQRAARHRIKCSWRRLRSAPSSRLRHSEPDNDPPYRADHANSHGEGSQHHNGRICGKGREPVEVSRPLRVSSTVTVSNPTEQPISLRITLSNLLKTFSPSFSCLTPLMHLSDLRRFGRVSSAEAVKGQWPWSARGNRKPSRARSVDVD